VFITQEERDAYYEHLRTISNINFTPRQIDIMACILNGMTHQQETANFLSIVRGVVEKHKCDISRILRENHKDGLETNIRKFLEKSDKYKEIKGHYVYLLKEHKFKEVIKEIGKLNRKETNKVCIYFIKDQDTKFLFDNNKRSDICNHLQFAGWSIEKKDIRYADTDSIDNAIKENYNSKTNQRIIFVVSEAFINSFNTNNHIKNIIEMISDKIQHNNLQNKIKIVFIEICEDMIPSNITTLLPKFKCIGFKRNYFLSFFELLEALNSGNEVEDKNIRLKDLIIKFKNSYDKDLDIFLSKNSSAIPRNPVNGETKISNLAILPQYVLIERKEILKSIKDKFTISKAQIVALVGAGGSGKTTLAQQYATGCDLTSLVWQINAETFSTISESFEDFTRSFASTVEEQNLLTVLDTIYDSHKKEKHLLILVNSILKRQSNWLLVYDNLEKFSDTHEYSPQSICKIKSEGKILITTRNSNILHNLYIQHIINVTELNDKQKFELFQKIWFYGCKGKKNLISKIDIKKVLAFIPPFPLDVTLAAAYLKQHRSISEYLENLQIYSKSFNLLNATLLRELGGYQNTRNDIVSISLDNILKSTDKEIKELLFFVSMLGSQNIPKKLLYKFKNSASVTHLVFLLKQYSLITYEETTNLGEVFSLHRVTQRLLLENLRGKISFKMEEKFLMFMANVVEDFIHSFVIEDQILNVKSMSSHCSTFLSNIKSSNKEAKSRINIAQGYIYYYSGDYTKSQQFLMSGIRTLKQQPSKNAIIIARALAQLGILYRRVEDFPGAFEALEESKLIYEEESIDNIEFAYTLSNLGNVRRLSGDFAGSIKLLEQSTKVYKKYSGEDVGYAKILENLGKTYRDYGYFSEAQKLLGRSIEICNKNEKKDISSILTALGVAYLLEGYSKEAEKLFKRSLKILESYGKKNHPDTAWNYFLLARVYTLTEQKNLAKINAVRSFILNKRYYPSVHSQILRNLIQLTIIYSDLILNNYNGDFYKNTMLQRLLLYLHKKYDIHATEEDIKAFQFIFETLKKNDLLVWNVINYKENCRRFYMPIRFPDLSCRSFVPRSISKMEKFKLDLQNTKSSIYNDRIYKMIGKLIEFELTKYAQHRISDLYLLELKKYKNINSVTIILDKKNSYVSNQLKHSFTLAGLDVNTENDCVKAIDNTIIFLLSKDGKVLSEKRVSILSHKNYNELCAKVIRKFFQNPNKSYRSNISSQSLQNIVAVDKQNSDILETKNLLSKIVNFFRRFL